MAAASPPSTAVFASAKAINVCYSLLAPEYAISVAGVYDVAGTSRVGVVGSGGVSPLGADENFRRSEAEHAAGWYAGICADAWGG